MVQAEGVHRTMNRAAHPRTRPIANGSGCARRRLPRDLLPRQLVYPLLPGVAAEGVRQTLHDALWPQCGEPRPPGGRDDAGKRVKGRKRHPAVDARGLRRAVVMHSAGTAFRVRGFSERMSAAPVPSRRSG